MNILIIEDEQYHLEGIKHTIAKGFPQYHVYTAASAQEAIKYLKDNDIQIAVTNISMRDMNGLEFISRYKLEYPSVKWLIMSASSEFYYVREAIRLGVKAYMLKPVVKSELEKTIKVLVNE
ncbi:putative response regulatory protein [compost metagenome]